MEGVGAGVSTTATRGIAALLSFCYLSVALLSGGHGLVLCRGANGNAKVELASSGFCQPLRGIINIEKHKSVSSSRVMGEEGCGECEDTPLSSHLAASCSKTQKQPTRVAGLCRWVESSLLSIGTCRASGRPPHLQAARPVLYAVSTVVLLI
jgi:hypothetical protein